MTCAASAGDAGVERGPGGRVGAEAGGDVADERGDRGGDGVGIGVDAGGEAVAQGLGEAERQAVESAGVDELRGGPRRSQRARVPSRSRVSTTSSKVFSKPRRRSEPSVPSSSSSERTPSTAMRGDAAVDG